MQNQKKAERRYEVAADTVDRMLVRLADDHLRRVPVLGDVRKQLLSDAVALFTSLLEIEPKNSQILLQRGRAQHALLLGEPALADMEMAIELAPSNHKAYFHLALLLTSTPILKLRDHERALFHARTAFELHPQSSEYRLLQASIVGQRFDYETSKPFLDEAMLLDPQNPVAYLTRAVVANMNDDAEVALKNIEIALKLGADRVPANSDGRVHHPYQLRGDAYKSVDRWSHVVDMSKRAAQSHKEYKAAFGAALFRAGRLSEAVRKAATVGCRIWQ